MKRLQLYHFPERLKGEVKMQAFSGLFFEAKHGDELVFWTHSDRGPNAEDYQEKGTKQKARPFYWKDYQPSLTQFKVNVKTQAVTYLQEIPLTLADGTPMNGLPNHPAQPGRTGDEKPVSLARDPLPYHPMGIDPEGICQVNNHFWLVEEYGPSLLKFDLTGKLVKRFVPEKYFNAPVANVSAVLPGDLMTRKLNRGFEGMSCSSTKIYLAMQSPLPSEGTNVRILEFDLQTEKVSKTLMYPLDSDKTDKIGDIAFHQGKLLVLEQNDTVHKVYALNPQDSKKTLFVDLVAEGYDFAQKVEGLAVVNGEYLAVVNDNDFGLTGGIKADHTPEIDVSKKAVLGLIKL